MSRISIGSSDAVPQQWVRFITPVFRFTRNALVPGAAHAVPQTPVPIAACAPPAARKAPMRAPPALRHHAISQFVSSARGWLPISRLLPLTRPVLPPAALHPQVAPSPRPFAFVTVPLHWHLPLRICHRAPSHLSPCPYTGIYLSPLIRIYHVFHAPSASPACALLDTPLAGRAT
jgi:hypothetical protein